MGDILSDRVLVVNRNYYPLGVISVERAIPLVFKEKAVIVDENYMTYPSIEEWSKANYHKLDRAVRTVNHLFIAPEVIRLLDHDTVFDRGINLTRSNLFMRDNFECCYCGSDQKLTVDHVVPKSRGKEFKMTPFQVHSWKNLVTACAPCNTSKGNQTPEEAGMTLNVQPYKPVFLKFGLKKHWKSSWTKYLGEAS